MFVSQSLKYQLVSVSYIQGDELVVSYRGVSYKKELHVPKVSTKLEVSKIQRTCSDLLLQILSKYATILRTSHLLRVEPTIE